ncbi:MAG: 2Fe-2S iron-sulfur cluster binding domain-containing protein, partial [Planctomycetes bacterium]|nr:2Fe-2S iron-sulfur cluster binding domain-containing protein [Planctomycetota bacterium]
MKHCNVTFDPDGKTISIHAGATVLEAAGQVGIILNTVCGGQGTCGKCAVTLTGPEGPGRRVMACQHRIEGDITVTIEPDSGFFAQQILQHGIDHQISVALGDRTESLYGIALDIGTTTVVARLIDMSDGTCIATAGILNPQGICGDDVISRIAYAETE